MSGFTPRAFTVTLYQGDYQQRIAEAAQAVEAAEKNTVKSQAPRLASDLPEIEQRKRDHNTLVAEAEKQGSVKVTLRALGRRKWADLVRQHPPRSEDNLPQAIVEGDQALGVNDESFGEALVPLSVASISDPEIKVDDLLDAISDWQYNLLYQVAFGLNRDGGPSPKLLPSSAPSPSSDETSS